MQKIYYSIIATAVVFAACSSPKEESDNPFLKDYDTPFAIAPFEEITNADYVEAYELGRKEHNENIDKIVNNTEEPTFENTIYALEESSPLLNKVSSVFNNITSCNTNDSIEAIAKDLAPVMSAHYDAINMNAKLFERVKAVYDKRNELGLTTEQNSLLENEYKAFVRSGALLNKEQKAELSAINQELSQLTLEFGTNVLAETNNYELVVDNEDDLKGLSQSDKDRAAAAAKEKGYDGKWLFTTQRSSIDPFLASADNRELRKELYNAYIMRGDNNNDNDNKEVLRKMVNLRLKRANLLGYENYAAYILEENMAKNSDNVYNMLRKIMKMSTKVAKEELADMQAYVDAHGGNFKVQGYDWAYYTEKVREQKFNMNSSELKPYFEMNNVVKSAFYTLNQLYGLQIEEIHDVPVPHPDVKAFEVKEQDGSHVGILFMDFYARPSKRGGAWMSSYRKQQIKDGEFIHPIITVCYNFAKPAGDDASLLSLDEAYTVFHELGHAVQGLLSNCTYRSISGTAVSRDYVEMPSQMMEHWLTRPEVMDIYAHHYKTGEKMPEELKNKMLESAKFNQGFLTTEYLGAAFLDMDYHTITEPLTMNIDQFEKEANARMGLIPEITNRYRSTYFSHIFAGGYAAGYYAYIWAAVLDSDAFAAFSEKQTFDKEVAARFRKYVLETGGSDDSMKLYKEFRGKEPNEKYLLMDRGLISE